MVSARKVQCVSYAYCADCVCDPIWQCGIFAYINHLVEKVSVIAWWDLSVLVWKWG